jgi:hypothetical protein
VRESLPYLEQLRKKDSSFVAVDANGTNESVSLLSSACVVWLALG